jgi:molybdopterin synthase catalytic subunit
MSIQVHIVDGALGETAPWRIEGAGAVLCFEGIVRPTEDGQPIAALDYEVYEPMASKVLAQIAEDLAASHGLLAVRVEHSRGRVGAGRCSFRLCVASIHRKEGLDAMDRFIDRLKRDVPIWKRAVPA